MVLGLMPSYLLVCIHCQRFNRHDDQNLSLPGNVLVSHANNIVRSIVRNSQFTCDHRTVNKFSKPTITIRCWIGLWLKMPPMLPASPAGSSIERIPRELRLNVLLCWGWLKAFVDHIMSYPLPYPVRMSTWNSWNSWNSQFQHHAGFQRFHPLSKGETWWNIAHRNSRASHSSMESLVTFEKCLNNKTIISHKVCFREPHVSES